MPVYQLYCCNCNRTFQGMVMAGTREPEQWVCSQCGKHDTKRLHTSTGDHPLEANQGTGCPCCGGPSSSSI